MSPIERSGGGGGGTPVTELDYAQITANVTVSGSSGAQTTVITGHSIALDGVTRIEVAFYAALVEVASTAGHFVSIELWDGATDLCELTGVTNPASTNAMDVMCAASFFTTPSAGNHQYIIKAFTNVGGPNGLIAAGNGSGGNFAPSYLRVTSHS